MLSKSLILVDPDRNKAEKTPDADAADALHGKAVSGIPGVSAPFYPCSHTTGKGGMLF